jgi:hypothetical protein
LAVILVSKVGVALQIKFAKRDIIVDEECPYFVVSPVDYRHYSITSRVSSLHVSHRDSVEIFWKFD